MPPENIKLQLTGSITQQWPVLSCSAQNSAIACSIAVLNRHNTAIRPTSVTTAETHIEPPCEELVLDSGDLPLVSIIIRSMDRPFLSEAMNSVALQTYPNIEVVVVDAKGEGHREIGTLCGRFPLRLCGTGRRLKRSPAANFGMDSASGSYLIFLDDDDLFYPNHIASLVEALNSTKDCLVAYAGVRVEDNAGATVGVYNQSFSKARFMAGNFIPIHAVLFKRELVDQGCRFDECLDSYEDWDFWLQVARLTDFVHTAEVSAVYRAQLGESGMSLATADLLELQRQARLTVWDKWLPTWLASDFDDLVADFHHQLDAVNEQPYEQIAFLTQGMSEREEQIALLTQGVNEREEQIALLTQGVNEREEQIALLTQGMNEREEQIALLTQGVSEREELIAQTQATVEALLHSTSWKLTAPVRFLGRTIRSARKVFGYRRIFFDLMLRHSNPKDTCKFIKRTFTIVRSEGLAGIKLRAKALNGNHAQTVDFCLQAKPGAKNKQHNYLPLSSIDIAKYDFFFFDVFDTAIIRLFQRPIDLFEYISFKTCNPDFHLDRIRQEAQTRERFPERKDISLSDIYSNLTGAAIDEEIAAELRFCIAHQEIHAFYSKLLAAGKKIYFVSDMYLDKSTISVILEQNGFATYEDIYVSSEDDLVKGDGSRFDWLKKTLPASVGTAMHIGDNLIADFMQPQAHGFDALHFMESEAYYLHDPFLYSKIEFLNSQHSLGLSFMLATFRYWQTGFRGQAPDYWRQFGFFYGGALVSAFCSFIAHQLSTRKLVCDKVFFLARDGDIMSKVYNLLYDDVEPVYLLASRRCMSLPSLTSLTHADDASVLRLFTTPLGVSNANDVLERFCYPDLQELEVDLLKIAPDWTDFSIRECFLRNKKSIMEKAVAERGVLLDYLSEQGFFAQQDIVIADVGWSGSIQNSLVKLLELGGYKKNHLQGVYLGVNNNVEHKQNKTGFLFDGDQSQFAAYLNLIELITSSPLDGVIRIDHVDGSFFPVVGTVSEYEKQRQIVAAKIQQGIMDFAHIIKARGISSLDFIRPDDFKVLFTALQEHASEEDVSHLGQLRHAMTLGNNYGQHILTKQ